MSEKSNLAQLLQDAASALGATISPAAPELGGDGFNFEVLGDTTSRISTKRRATDLPSTITAVRIDDIPVLIGHIEGPPQRVVLDAQLRRLRNQASIARSWLAAEAANLQLFLVAPAGSLSDFNWRQAAAEIEADERTCRKLCWLYNSPPDQDTAIAFLNRTFVARPWPKTAAQVPLDVIANYLLPPGWEEAAQNAALDFDGLVDRLIELEPSNG